MDWNSIVLGVADAIAGGVVIDSAKAAFRHAFGEHGASFEALESLEEQPRSVERRLALVTALKEANAEASPEVLDALKSLLAEQSATGGTFNLVSASGAGSAVSGSGTATVSNIWGTHDGEHLNSNIQPDSEVPR